MWMFLKDFIFDMFLLIIIGKSFYSFGFVLVFMNSFEKVFNNLC